MTRQRRESRFAGNLLVGVVAAIGMGSIFWLFTRAPLPLVVLVGAVLGVLAVVQEALWRRWTERRR